MIKQIIHLADLHIRTGDITKCRYEEYRSVFTKFTDYLKTLDSIVRGEAIIILAGDLFHHKNKLESVGIKLFFDFVTTLGVLAPTYIIRGNHDYKQESPDEPDMIESLLTVDIPNVTYWRDSGHYVLGGDGDDGNLGIGLVAIQHALKSGNTAGITDNLPQFPDPTAFSQTVKHKIALFHGAVSQTRLPSGETMSASAHTYPLEWFKGYDVIMLGDIHLQQVQRAKCLNVLKPTPLSKDVYVIQKYSWDNATSPPFCYAGSMIQQDFGETLLGHGFAIWDLPTKTITCAHVCNDYGLITLKHRPDPDNDIMTNDNLLVHVKCFEHNAWLPLSQIHNVPWLPKKVAIRLASSHTHDPSMLADIAAKCQRDYQMQVLSINFYTTNAKTTNTNDVGNDVNADATTDDVITNCNTPQTWIAFIEDALRTKNPDTSVLLNDGDNMTTWRDWFMNIESICVPEEVTENMCGNNATISTKINDRNDKIQKKIDAYLVKRDEAVTACRRRFKLHRMTWNWILCYRDGNWFDFDSLDGRIAAINAKNGNGKTSFLETICLALFGEGFPSRTNKQYPTSIICQQIPPSESAATTQITVGIFGSNGKREMYRISRGFQPSTSQKLKTTKDTLLDRIIDPVTGSIENVHSGRTAVDAWVNKHIGTIDAFLMSCMVTQASDKDFFSMSSQDQKALLDRAMSLDTHAKYMEIVKESKLAHQSIGELLSSAKVALLNQNPPHNITPQQIEALKADLEKVRSAKKELEDRRTDCAVQCAADTDDDAMTNIPSKDVLIAKVAALSGEMQYTHNNNQTLEEMIAELGKLEAALTATTFNYSDDGGDADMNIDGMRQRIAALDANIQESELIAKSGIAITPEQRAILQNELDMYVKWEGYDMDKTQLEKEDKNLQFHITKNAKELDKYRKLYDDILARRNDTQAKLDTLTNGQWKDLMSRKPPPQRGTQDARAKWQEAIDEMEEIYGAEDPLASVIARITEQKKILEATPLTVTKHEYDTKTALIKMANKIPKTQHTSLQDVATDKAKLEADIAICDSEMTQLTDAIERIQNMITDHLKNRRHHHFSPESVDRLSFDELKKEQNQLADAIEYAIEERDNLADYIKTLEDVIKQCEPIAKRIEQLNKELSERTKELEECASHPINPSCEACRNAPWKTRLIALVGEKRREIQKEQRALTDILSEYDHHTLEDVEKELADVKRNIEMIDRYNVLEWQCTFSDLNTTFATKKQELDDAKNKRALLCEQQALLINCEEILKARVCIETYERERDAQEVIKEALTHLESDKDVLVKLEAKRGFWEEEDANAAARITWQADMDKVDAEMSELKETLAKLMEDCDTYEKGIKAADDKRVDLEKRADTLTRIIREWNAHWCRIDTYNAKYLKTWELMDERDGLRNRVTLMETREAAEKLRKCIESRTTLDKYKRMIEIWDVWHEMHNVLPSAIAELDAQLSSDTGKLRELELCYEQDQKLLETIAEYDTWIERLHNRTKALNELNEIMMGFAVWIYSARVLPMLCSYSNDIIRVMCGMERPLAISAEFNTNNSNTGFNWFLKDGTAANPPIEKASGFQRFVCSLGMRIALGRVGACGMNPRQLFLDEGFTACDGDNLARVPDFLRNMLEMYDSIVIVSHLEELKNCVDASIMIERNQERGLSHMCWGSSPYQHQLLEQEKEKENKAIPLKETQSQPPQKRRGRPPKHPKTPAN